MAFRGILLSFGLTLLVGYSLTAGLTDPNSPLKKLPDWTSFPIVVGIGLLYLLAIWWTFQEFSQHKFLSIISLIFCLMGVGLYAAVISMELDRGKASPGQYDYDFSALIPAEKTTLTQFAENAGLTLNDATFTEHWNLDKPDRGFLICVQRGHVTGLSLSDHPLNDVSALSQLPNLGDLYLKHCGLHNVSKLRGAKIDRLDLSNNQLTDLRSLSGCPNVRWLLLANNQITSLDGLDAFPNIVVKDFSGNPVNK
ncbi:hypothetical protein GCM10028807_01370 [Spirosoma daeguense]